MTINWYPGHMNKARKDITKALLNVDLVIEIVDARLPYSSENPLLNSLIADKARIKILNKNDLADTSVTQSWLEHFKSHGINAFAFDKSQESNIRKLIKNIRKMVNKPAGKLLRIMIVGIPNVGKSTFLNILLDRRVAKVGNEPAVTKARQEIMLDDHIKLIDTPGVLWPKIEDQNSAYRLAVTGAIKNTAIEFEDIALFALEFLRDDYPNRLCERYGLESPSRSGAELLAEVASLRGCRRKGGLDYHKASEIILQDLRNGAFGKVSLEKPNSLTFNIE